MADDTFEQMVSRLTTRQAWPRNFKFGSPRSLGHPSRVPYPSNVRYGRPRTVDRTNINDVPPDPEPDE